MKTPHLSPSEFVDLAEDTLSPRRAAHVDTCAPCREQGDALRVLLRGTRSVEVPEPSPLFWKHLAARVRDAIATEPGLGRSGWKGTAVRGVVQFAVAAALIVAVGSSVWLLRAVREADTASPPVTGQTAMAPATPAPGRPDTTPDEENAEVWAVLTAAASSVEFEDARDAGMLVHPATIEHAVQGLTSAELTELGRLLQSELKHASD